MNKIIRQTTLNGITYKIEHLAGEVFEFVLYHDRDRVLLTRGKLWLVEAEWERLHKRAKVAH